VHLVDTVAHPIWFRISYAFPQLLALLGFVTFGVLAGAHAWILGIALGAYLLACALAKVSMPLYYIVAIGGVVATLVLAFLMTHWLSLVLLAGFVAAVPWPSATRANWELRGYSMQLAIMQWGGPDSVSPVGSLELHGLRLLLHDVERREHVGED
jgi:hypothetical protein